MSHRTLPQPTPHRPALRAALLALMLAGCATLPDVTAQTAEPAPIPQPRLVPIAGILAQADAVPTATDAANPVTTRADTLRARADALRRQ